LLIPEKNKINFLLIIFCLFFFLICLFSIIKYGNSTLLGSLSNPDNDDVKFIRSAWVLVETGKYVYHDPAAASVFMMPGLSYTLAFFVVIFGKYDGITAFRVFQALIQTGSLLMVFLIARKIFNNKAGLIAVITSFLYIADYWVVNLILTETIFKFFLLCLLYFSINGIEQNKSIYYVFGGIAFGMAVLFRPAIATFPIIILFMWIRYKYKLTKILKYTIIVSAVFCLIMSPWWLRNYSIFHKFIPLTLATGNPMLQGTYIFYDQSSAQTDGLDYSRFQYPTGSEIENNEVEIEISKYRLRNLVPQHPLQFLLWYTIGKTIYQIAYPFYGTMGFLGINLWLAGFLHIVILLFSFFGIFKYYQDKKRNKMGVILLATIIYFIIAYLPFFTMGRYFYPAMPFVIIFAAYGFQQKFFPGQS
jgi:4-amino-4-deoxy-L-arabinose transferase-like glycosyltransferase